MSRNEFMQELAKLLKSVPEQELTEIAKRRPLEQGRLFYTIKPASPDKPLEQQ
jgi:hypothetical protein